MPDTSNDTPSPVLDLVSGAFQSVGECLQSIGSLFKFCSSVRKSLAASRARYVPCLDRRSTTTHLDIVLTACLKQTRQSARTLRGPSGCVRSITTRASLENTLGGCVVEQVCLGDYVHRELGDSSQGERDVATPQKQDLREPWGEVMPCPRENK
jgi:hypothetical protein